MVTRDSPEKEEQRTDDGLTLTRRTALGLLGVGGAGAMLTGSATASHGTDTDSVRPWNQHVDARNHDLRNLHALDTQHVYTAARDADVIVWKDEDGVFHADNHEETVHSGENMREVIQAAIDSLTDGRDWKEKVVVASSGTFERTADSAEGLRVPSYTTLDVPATIRVETSDSIPDGESAATSIPVKAVDAEHVEIPNINIEGDISWGIKMESVSNVRIGHAYLNVTGGLPIRIDYEGSKGRSEDIQLNSAYVEGGDHHAFETRGVDRLQVGQIIGKHMHGCAVLLNETADATVNSVIGYNPEADSRYATFRVTAHEGRVAVGEIVSHDAPRGLHIHAGTGEIVVGNVYIDGARNRGVYITGAPNTVLNGGVIKNSSGAAVDIYSQLDARSDPERAADGVTVTNLQITDDRPQAEREQTYAIREFGHAMNNQIVNNDVRDGGTEGLIDVGSESTVVRDNVGDGIASGTVTLESGADPAAVVEGVSRHRAVSLDLRAKPHDPPFASFAWDHHFEYNGDTDQWDLIVEWRTDPGEDVELDYIVDRPQANLGRHPSEPSHFKGPVETGTYRIENVHSRNVMAVDGGSTDENVHQREWDSEASQRWNVEELEGYEGQYRIENADTGSVLEADQNDVRVGEWSGQAHQRWSLEEYEGGRYLVRSIDADDVAAVEWLAGAGGNVSLQQSSDRGDHIELWTFRSE